MMVGPHILSGTALQAPPAWTNSINREPDSGGVAVLPAPGHQEGNDPEEHPPSMANRIMDSEAGGRRDGQQAGMLPGFVQEAAD